MTRCLLARDIGLFVLSDSSPAKIMAHNLLVVGLDDRCFTYPVEADVQVGSLKEWLAQKEVK